MKHNEIILRNQAHPRLTATTTTSSGNGTSTLYVDTGPGYIELGPANSSHCHIQTDRSNFYFNKELRVDSGVIGSYNEDLYLRRASNSSHQIQIGTDYVASSLPLELSHEGGGSATTGGRFLWAKYSGNNRIGVFSSQYGSGNLLIGNGMSYDSSANQIVSTFSNFSDARTGFELNRGGVGFSGTTGDVQTAVDSAITTQQTFLHQTTDGYTRIGTPTGTQNSRLAIYKADNNVADHIIFYNGGTRVGEIGVFDNSWLRLNQTTANNIYTPRLLRADGGLYTTVGSATNPTFAIQNDNNTGMYSPGSDQLAFTTGGTRRVNISTSAINFYLDATAPYFNGTSGLKVNSTEVIDTNKVLKNITRADFANFSVTGTSTTSPSILRYANIGANPEGSHMSHPFFFNDLANFEARGGTVTVSGLSGGATLTECFRANGRFSSWSNGSYSGSTMTITLTNLPHALSYGGYIGIAFGNTSWCPSSCKIEVSTDGGSTWTTRLNSASAKEMYFTSTGTGGTGANAIRFTLGQAANTSSIRCTHIWAYNYNSNGMEDYFLSKAGGTINGAISSGAITSSGSSVFNPTSDMIIVNEPSTNTDLQTALRVGTAGGGLYFTTTNAIISKGAYYDGGWIATDTTGSSIDFTGNNRITFNTFSGATVGGTASLAERAHIDPTGLNVTGKITNNGSIHSDTTFAFLTTSSNAQNIRTKSVFAGTSYNDTPPAGSFNATNTYELNGTTVIDQSRNLTNIATVTADRVLAKNTGLGADDFFAINEHDTNESIRHKFDVEGNTNFTKVTDGTAPAPGVFQVSGNHSPIWGPYIPIDDDTEIVFECWVKYTSGGDTTGNFYVGGQFYDQNLSSLGNNQRYWGANGDSFDADSGHSDWKHIKGVLKGSAIRAVSSTSTAKFVRFLTLFNYNASANTTRYCGFRFYDSRKTVTSLYHKKASHTSGYDDTNFGASYTGGASDDVIEVIDNAGNFTVPGTLTTSGAITSTNLSVSGYLNIGTRIGTVSPGLSITGDTNSTPIIAKAGHDTMSILPWDNITYIASGTYYDDGTWVHASTYNDEALLGISGNTGGRWYATTNGVGGSWNTASNVQLWNNSGVWTNSVNTPSSVQAGFYKVGSTTIIDASRNITNAGTITAGLTKLTPSGYSTVPQGFAALNIGRNGNGETRAIDIWGSWAVGESKSITFNHGSSSTQMVGQINVAHKPTTNSGGSSIRWGKLYHGGDSSTYTMELHSESTSLAYLSMNAGMVQIGQDSTYANYGVIGFGGRSNGGNRVFGHNGTSDGLFLASATGHGIYMRPNGGGATKLTVAAGGQVEIAQGDITLDQDGTYGAGYGTIGFGGTGNGSNRVFGSNSTNDGLYLAAATGRGIFFRVNGSGANSWSIDSSGNLNAGGGAGTTVIDQSRNLTNIGTISSGAITSSGNVTLNNDSLKFAAPVYRRSSISSVNNSGFTTLFTVDGNGLASTIRMTLAGTTGSVVVNLTADITVGHYQDILITSRSGFYTLVTLKVISNDNEDFVVQAKTNHQNAVTLAVEVFPLNNETVTFTSSHSFTGSSHEHVCNYGVATSGTGGNGGDYRVRGRTFIQDGGQTAPALAFENDLDTGIYRSATDKIGLTCANALRAEISNGGIDIKTGGVAIAANTVIDASRNLTNIAGLDMMASTTADIDLNRSGFITFYGSSDRKHGIGSRDNAGSASDDIRVNTFGSLFVNLDSNNNNTSTADFVIGRHGSGTGAMDLLLSVSGESGDLISEGNITAYGTPSDIRLKENIETITNAVEKVQSLDGVTFNYKKDGGRSTGLIAQQLQEVLPEVVYTAKDLEGEEHLAVRYGNVVGLLVEAIKEQQTQLTAQQEQINQLTILVNTLMEK